jgi:hypothetical protein
MTPSVALFLLLPILIAGYVLGASNYRFRYFSLRAEGQRLFFSSAGLGLATVAAYMLLMEWLAAKYSFNASQNFFDYLRISPDHPTGPAAWIALLLFAWLTAWLGNIIDLVIQRKSPGTTREKVFSRLIESHGSSLAKLLRTAANSQRLVLITLKSRKVYCGRIIAAPIDIDHSNPFVELLPIFSSYRDKDSFALSDDRTPYPIMALWEAQKAKKVAESELSNLEKEIEMPRNKDLDDKVKEDLAHMQMKIKERIDQASRAIDDFLRDNDHPLLNNIDLSGWIKVFPISEIESASFFETNLPKHWFKKGSKDVPEMAGSGNRGKDLTRPDSVDTSAPKTPHPMG